MEKGMFDLGAKSLVLSLFDLPFEFVSITYSNVHNKPKPVGEVKMVWTAR